MTEEQKQMIVRLRNVGLGYRKIAIVLELSRDKVRNYCKAIGLDGYAKKRLHIYHMLRIINLIQYQEIL